MNVLTHPVCIAPEPTPDMVAAFQRGFHEQLRIRHRARFKSCPTPREQMSAEEAGLRAMLKVAPFPGGGTPAA